MTWSETSHQCGNIVRIRVRFWIPAGEAGWRAMAPEQEHSMRANVHAGPRGVRLFAAPALRRRGRRPTSTDASVLLVAMGRLAPPRRRTRVPAQLRRPLPAKESPRWLVAKGRSEEAYILRGCYPPSADVDAVVAAIQGRDRQKSATRPTAYGWSALLWRPTKTTKSCWRGCRRRGSQQTTAIEAIQYYILYILGGRWRGTRSKQFGIDTCGVYQGYADSGGWWLFDHRN